MQIGEQTRILLQQQMTLAGLEESLVLSATEHFHKLLQTLEASDKLMHQVLLHAQEGSKIRIKDGGSGSVEYGLVLYWVQHPPTIIQEIIEQLKLPSWVWSLLQSLAPQPTVTQAQYIFLTSQLDKGQVIITPDGSVIGGHQYDLLDKHWLYAFFNYLLNIIHPAGIAEFGTQPFVGEMGSAEKDKVRIMIIGDWGTGAFDESSDNSTSPSGYDPSTEVIAAVETIQPDYLIHLGDVYYAGTEERLPTGEEQKNFLDLWPSYLPIGRSFTLNSNHEMYGGANGYFNIALGRNGTVTPFSHQHGTSYFALNFGEWVVVGLDAAYHDPSSLYMEGSLGDASKHPEQYAFLKEVTQGKKVILLSHQTAMSTDGLKPLQLWQDIHETANITPDYWYWGHIHLGIAYSDSSYLGQQGVKTRCVGHSAVPFGTPWEFSNQPAIDWFANTPVGLPHTQNLNKNGYAVVTLHRSGEIEEAFFETGNNSPVWVK